jgi:hypothetical protein
MSAIAARQARTPTTSAAAYRPATAALDQSPDLSSAIPVAQLLRSNLDRPLHAPTTPAARYGAETMLSIGAGGWSVPAAAPGKPIWS